MTEKAVAFSEQPEQTQMNFHLIGRQFREIAGDGAWRSLMETKSAMCVCAHPNALRRRGEELGAVASVSGRCGPTCSVMALLFPISDIACSIS